MPEYKLTYFNARGGAELARLIFHAGGIKFIDNRIDDWPALKPTIPHGTLPAFEIDGKMYGQSIAIARYVAKLAGLNGKTPTEELEADVVVDTTLDLKNMFVAAFLEKDATRKATLMKTFQTETVTKFLDIFTNVLKKNGGNFYVGKSLTWADLSIYAILEMVAREPAVLAKYPELAAFKKRIADIPSISAYLKVRPKTDM